MVRLAKRAITNDTGRVGSIPPSFNLEAPPPPFALQRSPPFTKGHGPYLIPRTPHGLDKAVRRPPLIISSLLEGLLHVPTAHRKEEATSSFCIIQKRTQMFVIPDGPAAAPLLDEHRFFCLHRVQRGLHVGNSPVGGNGSRREGCRQGSSDLTMWHGHLGQRLDFDVIASSAGAHAS